MTDTDWKARAEQAEALAMRSQAEAAGLRAALSNLVNQIDRVVTRDWRDDIWLELGRGRAALADSPLAALAGKVLVRAKHWREIETEQIASHIGDEERAEAEYKTAVDAWQAAEKGK